MLAGEQTLPQEESKKKRKVPARSTLTSRERGHKSKNRAARQMQKPGQHNELVYEHGHEPVKIQ